MMYRSAKLTPLYLKQSVSRHQPSYRTIGIRDVFQTAQWNGVRACVRAKAVQGNVYTVISADAFQRCSAILISLPATA
jgi:hypothetical protein